MNRILEKIKILATALPKSDIEALIDFLKDLILDPSHEVIEVPSEASSATKSLPISLPIRETKEIKGHKYEYERRREKVITPDGQKYVLRSKYIGKASSS